MLWEMEKCCGRKGSEGECRQKKGMQLIFGKKSTVSKVDTFDVCGERCWL